MRVTTDVSVPTAAPVAIVELLMENTDDKHPKREHGQLVRVTVCRQQILVDVLGNDDEHTSRGRMVLEATGDVFRFQIDDERGEFRNTPGSDGHICRLDHAAVAPVLDFGRGDGWYVLHRDDGGAGALVVGGVGPFEKRAAALRAAVHHFCAPEFLVLVESEKEVVRMEITDEQAAEAEDMNKI